jgi:hypothetical protein
MSVTGLESMKGDGMGVFARKNRLQVESTIAAGDPTDESEAQVSDGRLHTKALLVSDGGDVAAIGSDGSLLTNPLPDGNSRTVTTGKSTVGNSAVTIASATSGRNSLTIQNQTTSPLAVCFSSSTPGSDDFQIAAGGTFVLPFPYSGVVKAKTLDTGVSGNVVVIEGTV